VSQHSAGSLRHALKQVAVTGATGSLLLGGALGGLATSGPAVAAAPIAKPATTTTGTTGSSDTTGTTAAVKLRTAPTASHTRRKVNVGLEMRTAAALKGRPYRYGAAGPRAFDCSGYVQYVFKKQHWKLKRTAAAQYRQTKHVSKKSARTGDLVFFYGSRGAYHVGIYAGRGRMWAAPHTGAKVRNQKIYGSNWKVGRVV
jgi:cell wall-associated NlpC family hydrolase